MADKTSIEWADATLNYVNGCTRISPGCGGPGDVGGCYAELLAGTRMRNHATREGLTVQTPKGPRWTGKIHVHEPALQQALRWRRPRRIFWNAHGDIFHDAVPDEVINRLFAVCALTPHHTHLILTKRPKRMREYVCDWREWEMKRRLAGLSFPGKTDDLLRQADLRDEDLHVNNMVSGYANIWLGVSVEDQIRADERREDFRQTPAAVKFVSYEPALGPVDWSGWEFVSQIIGGGESGPNARPCHPDWQRATRDFCQPRGIAYFFKQWGAWAPICEMSEELTESVYHPAPEHSPEAARRCKVDLCVLHRDGARFDGRAMYEPKAFWQGTGAMTMYAVGKSKSGRRLDGVEHNGMPEALK